MIRAHLLAEIKPRGVGPVCTPLLPHHLLQYNAVCVVLRKRLHDAKRTEENKIKAAKNTTDISSIFSMKPTVEQVTEQWTGCVL
jgi:hypothetical protein